MAYKGYRITSASMTAAAFFTAVCTALEAMGWVVHDAVSSSIKVYKSNGEDGTKKYGYVKLTNDGSNLRVRAYLRWDATSHTGYSGAIPSGYNDYIPASTAYIGIYGNKDFVFLESSGANPLCFGHVPSPVNTAPLATLLSAVSAGSDKTLSVADSAGFAPGTNYMLVDFDTGNRDTIMVSAVPDGVSLTAYSVPRNYASGSYIGACPIRFGQNSYTELLITAMPGVSAGTAETADGNGFYMRGFTQGITDAVSGRNIMSPFAFARSNCLLGFSGDLEVCWVASTVALNTVWGVCNGWSPEQGQATTSTSTTLTDGAKAWSVDQWVDKYLVIIEGAGTGQARKITGNGPTELTVATAWATNPDGTSIYRVVDQAWRSIFSGAMMALELDHAV